ncbi:hypothetical protein AG1IA_08759 [Rhizoctonia solani AG-1 IA]|uniref:Uncharacterized protein n=1 Tax=Thanatephorus cucumeris (strain AG1-IA) TaxID=983506 RepID=L8WG94_THACA|nr:hypothetical protein AG1IA_08759 [Rhizoctonia solani AG-1 IA]
MATEDPDINEIVHITEPGAYIQADHFLGNTSASNSVQLHPSDRLKANHRNSFSVLLGKSLFNLVLADSNACYVFR